MIYFLHGGDAERSRLKAHELMEALRKKRPDAELFKMEGENWTAGEMERLVFGTGLFQSNYIVFLDHVLENPDAESFFLAALKDIESSSHVFILLEGELKKAVREKIEKTASKAQEFSAQKAAAKEFNAFALADALGSRDKKRLWVLYRESVNEGRAPEETHGLLFWQMKSMLQALNSENAQDAGLKPFVYSKALRFSKNFSPDELKKKSSELVSLYHDSRRGGEDLDVALEKWVLGI